MKKLAVLTGAGVSAESGIPTFRDSGGLWEGHDVMEVASPEGWAANPELVLNFYNERRKKALEVEPNEGHLILAQLEKYFNTVIITQNVDNLHEKAGSKNVLHLHGNLFESRSSLNPDLIYPITNPLKIGDLCELGSQLRPHIVWFGEMVPMLEVAIREVTNCDIFLIVGTSMVVYPAAGLIEYTPPECQKYLVDPNLEDQGEHPGMTYIQAVASKGMREVKQILLSQHAD